MSTMLDRGTAITAAVEVEKYSKQGTELLQTGHLTSAVKAFKYAYKYAGDMDDEYMERACAFNLGAAYIAMGQGEKGLNILQQAVPTEERRDGRSNGDLYFNFGLGYEVTKNVHEAVRYFNKALDEYRLEHDNLTMEIETLSKLAVLCVATNNHNLMNIYHQLAEAYAMQENTDKQMWALCEKANSYYSYGDPEKAESAADDCLKLSDKCHSALEIGSIFNDIGLLFTQLQKYDRAKKCFEEALPLAQSSGEKKKEAVIRQNLGAAYNFVGEYQRAIGFHKSAADMYARLQNRNSQGQCYANLAYAYSQLGDLMKAKQAFDHALLAAEDTDDNRTTWQVSEGLGSVAFNERNYDEAIECFKKALGVLARENNIIAQNRIVEKLKQALEAQIKEKERPRYGKEVMNPLKAGHKWDKTPAAEKPTRPTTAAPYTAEGSSEADQAERRFIRVSKSGSQKRFSKVARGLSDIMEPYQPSPRPDRSSSGLQGETLKPVPSESEEGSSESDSDSDSESETETDEEEEEDNRFESKKTEQSKQSDSKNVETGSNRSMRGSDESEDSLEDEETEESSDEEDQDKKAVRDQMRKIGGDSASEEDKDKDNEKMERKHTESKRQQPLDVEAHVKKGDKSSSDSESTSGSETGSTETDSDDEAPPLPSGSIPKTADVGTYENPWGSKKKTKYADINFDLSPPRDEDDPLYSTIPTRALENNDDDDDVQKEGPVFSNFSNLPRGEKERIMFEKHRQDQMDRQPPPPLPSRQEKDSKTCAVM